MINLGALAGSLIVGPLLNTQGRRASLRLSALPSAFGWLLMAVAQGLSPPATEVSPTLVVALIFGRVLSGLAVGIMTAVASVYLVEVAPPSQAGRFAAMAQVAIVGGTCVAYYCGMVVTWYETARYMIFVSLALFFASFYLPESPVWLARQDGPGKAHEALRELTWLRGDVSNAERFC